MWAAGFKGHGEPSVDISAVLRDHRRIPRIAIYSLWAIVACASAKTQGNEGGPCYPNGTCNGGLVCSGDTCVGPEGDAGVDGGVDGGTDGGTFVCDSDFSFEFAGLSACVSESCCTAFDRCFPDTVCRACLDTPTAECETDGLYMPLVDCIDANCPTSFCDSGIGFNAGDDPLGCNACVDANCCMEVAACVGGEGNPNLNDCLACLDDSESVGCVAAAMSTRDGAEDVARCIEAACTTDCSGLDL